MLNNKIIEMLLHFIDEECAEYLDWQAIADLVREFNEGEFTEEEALKRIKDVIDDCEYLASEADELAQERSEGY